MNSDTVKGDWKSFIGKAKETWGEWTDDATTAAQGSLENVYGSLQKSYGVTRDAFDGFVKGWNEGGHAETTTTTTTKTTTTSNSGKAA